MDWCKISESEVVLGTNYMTCVFIYEPMLSRSEYSNVYMPTHITRMERCPDTQPTLTIRHRHDMTSHLKANVTY